MILTAARSPSVAVTRTDPLPIAVTRPFRSTDTMPAGSALHVTCVVSSTYSDGGSTRVKMRALNCSDAPPTTTHWPPITLIDTILSAGGSGDATTGGVGEAGVSLLQP